MALYKYAYYYYYYYWTWEVGLNRTTNKVGIVSFFINNTGEYFTHFNINVLQSAGWYTVVCKRSTEVFSYPVYKLMRKCVFVQFFNVLLLVLCVIND